MWKEACLAENATLEGLISVLATFENTIEVLECIVTMPESLGHVMWIECTAAALSLLEKRGVGLEDVVAGAADDTDTEDAAYVHGGQPGAVGAEAATLLISEQERLMGSDAPHLSEGNCYLYLINRLSVLNAYLMASTKAKRRAVDPPAVAQQWNAALADVDFASDPHAPPLSPLRRAAGKAFEPPAREVRVSQFLCYFDMTAKAARLVRIDEALAEFVCGSLANGTVDVFTNVAHILSLSNTTVRNLLLLWLKDKPRGIHTAIPVAAFGRLVSAAILENIDDDEPPAWLSELHGTVSLTQAAYMVLATRHRVEGDDPEDYRLDVLDNWLKQLLSLVDLMARLPAHYHWAQALTPTALASVPVSAVVAAHSVHEHGVCEDALLDYVAARDGDGTYHAHAAMFLAYVAAREAADQASLRVLLFCPEWAALAEDVRAPYAEAAAAASGGDAQDEDRARLAERALRHLEAAGAHRAPAAHWCCAAFLAAAAAVVHVSRRQRATPAAACAACRVDAVWLQGTLAAAKQFVGLLPDDGELGAANGDEGLPGCGLRGAAEWWGAGAFDSMLTAGELARAASQRLLRKDELVLLLHFLREAVSPGVAALEPFSAQGSMRLGKLFSRHTLQLLQPTSKELAAATPQEDAACVAARRALVVEAVRAAETERMQDVGDRLMRALDVPGSHDAVLYEVVARFYYEGMDTRAMEAMGGEENCPFPEAYTEFLVKLVKLRLKHVLSSPVAGNCTQSESERSLNLVSSVPLELVEWVNTSQRATSRQEDALVAKWSAGMPKSLACQRLKVCACVVKQSATVREAVVLLLHFFFFKRISTFCNCPRPPHLSSQSLAHRTALRASQQHCDKQVVNKLQKALDFATYLVRNV